MLDSPPSSWPGSSDLRALVERAVAKRVEPLEAQLATVTEILSAKIEAEAQRRDEIARILLEAVSERLHALYVAQTKVAEVSEERLVALLQGTSATALTSRVGPLVDRLAEAVDELGLEGGRMETLARGHAGQARAVEDRVAALCVEVAERVESAVVQRRARHPDEQVGPGTGVDSSTTELLQMIGGSTARLEAGLTELRTALVDEQAAAREAQLAGIEALSSRIEEVGAKLSGSVVPELQRATRAAEAAQEGAARSGDDGRPGPTDDASGIRRGQPDPRMADELHAVANGVARLRAELLDLVARALERFQAAAEGITQSNETVIDDLRASQAVLREAVQEGVQKAELTALDVRGLRERLGPHLAALAEAANRRAESDQAGFDAVLGRLDQLLRQPGAEPLDAW